MLRTVIQYTHFSKTTYHEIFIRGVWARVLYEANFDTQVDNDREVVRVGVGEVLDVLEALGDAEAMRVHVLELCTHKRTYARTHVNAKTRSGHQTTKILL